MIIYDPKITGSFQVNGSTVTSIGEVDTISGSVAALNAATSSYALSSSISGSFTSLSASLSTRLTDDEGSIDSLNAASSSYLLNTTDTLTGDLTVTGTITAQEFHTEFVSASIIYKSGSTQFGNSSDDTHTFTGTVSISDGTLNLGNDSVASYVNGIGDVLVLDVDSDNDSGGSPNIQFKTGGSEKMRISNDGVLKFTNTASSTGDGGTIAHYTNNFMYIRGGSSGLAIGDDGFDSNIYINDNNYINFTTAGTERMRIYSSGYVTIGDISSAPTGTVPLTVFRSGANANLAIQSGGGSGRKYELISNTAGDFIIYDVNGTTEKLNITADGNVGIGSTTPGSKLTVNPSGAGDGALRLGVLNQEQYVFETGISGVTNAALILKDVSTPYTYMTFRGGYVGIGTTSPQVKLDVQTDADSTQIARFWNSNSGTSAHSVVRIASSANNANSARLEFSDANYYTATISGDRVQGLFFRTSATGADPTTIPVRMVINTSGDIGIGSTSPTQKLDVGGVGIFGDIGSYRSSLDGSSSGAFLRFGDNADIDSLGTIGTYGSAMMYETAQGLGHIFKTGAGVNGTEVMRIGSGGDVLISTNGKFLQGIRNTNGSIIDMIGFGAGTDTLQIKGGTSGGANAISFYDTGGFIATFYNENLGLGTTAPKGKLDVRGCVAMGPAIYDGNLSRSTTNFSQQDGGSLHINWGLGGTSSSGDTITFTYAATSWKSWSLKYNFASTNGITQGVVGGYWNNSGSNSNHVDIDNLGMSLAVTHGGTGNQNIIVTFTFTALGTHPMANFVYMQAGGDGQPRMDRVTLNAVS